MTTAIIKNYNLAFDLGGKDGETPYKVEWDAPFYDTADLRSIKSFLFHCHERNILPIVAIFTPE